ncbi:MAG: alpha-glucan family phosphorylase [Gammaproteobacteria bacterium]
MQPNRYLLRPLPPPLEGLAELALDLRGVRHHGTEALWQAVDPALWQATGGNPWLILESVSERRLQALAEDVVFVKKLTEQLKARARYLRQRRWFDERFDAKALGMVAYFSMEFGLSEALPIYSGGLGILAGDHLKAVSDLGVPVVGVGLLYQQGYFRQSLDRQGNQLALYPYNAPSMLPVMPLRDAEGQWLKVSVEFPARTVYLRVWEARVGRAMLFLLDSNDPMNSPADRTITSELYGGAQELRLQQEIALGIGGWRLVEALAINAEVCHLNEGHAAFAVLERARNFMAQGQASFAVALACTRAGNLFTTHTPVAAGFDRFPPALFAQYFQDYALTLGMALKDLLALGCADPSDPHEPFNMAYLALRGSAAANGVSRLHGEVSRRLFAPLFSRWPLVEVPVGHVTNGVHVPSWDSELADELWTESCGAERWYGDLQTLESDLKVVSDDVLWALRNRSRVALIQAVRSRVARAVAAHGAKADVVAECGHWLDPNVLTLGFARRFASYKRPNLLLQDPQRLRGLLTDEDRPLQIIIAGKAHPQDEAGKRMVREWFEFLQRPEIRGRAMFLEDYDMSLAAELVQGVDLWLNTPRRPWEASGTSGMKVLANGGLNLSELDGWWSEAYDPEVGWALGDGQEHGDDPVWDAEEARALYRILEEEVIPAFYDRDEKGIPIRWVGRVRESMARLTPRFSSNRMVRDYTEQYYLPRANAYRRRIAQRAGLGKAISAWQETLAKCWRELRWGRLEVQDERGAYVFQVDVYLGQIPSDAVRVELYAQPLGTEEAECHAMTRGELLAGDHNGYGFSVRIASTRPATDYTPRIVPVHSEAVVPLEADHISWRD